MIYRLLITILLVLVTPLVMGTPNFKVVYYDGFPPYSYKNEAGQMTGILVDIVTEVIEKQMGLNVVHKGYPWGRAQRMVFNGQADAFISVPTDARLQHVSISDTPVFVGPINLFTYRHHPGLDILMRVSDTEGLRAFQILDYIGNGWGEANLPQNQYTRSLTPNISNALQMLAKKRGDVVVTDKVVARYFIAKHQLQDAIIEIPTTLDIVSFSLCISNQSPHLGILAAFSKKITQFRQQGGEQSVLEKYR
ncbi:transporter substrate-binding domain-containing protein [Pseudoalteromonas rubra]|uniref:Transporter substrate-binding domain-containing protein n=2 Tax=Pseudoalteromonas TaxID=53246 RepID=A0A5S3UUX5_9GAMM|nr:transporter substrate-binding domain-containing protein [Pseudoalteromonas rubra]QPB82399.1 transporter substrate-binding domain-containing protein [Pseudoalteromonas rubra]